MSYSVYRNGPEIRMDVSEGKNPYDLEVEGLSDGGWISCWMEGSATGPGQELFFQRYNAKGEPVGTVIQVTSPPVAPASTGLNGHGNVTLMADGGWLITWVNTTATESTVYQRRYDKNGDPLNDGQVIGTPTDGFNRNTYAATLSDGSYVVTWAQSATSSADFDVYQQHFDADGNPLGTESIISSTTTNDQVRSQIAALKDGGWVVTWYSGGATGGEIHQQRFNSSGSKVGAETIVNATTADRQSIPDIAVLADGSYVITWQSNLQDSSDFGVYQRHYDENGNAITGEIQVNTSVQGYQGDANIAALADGGWTVTWQGADQNQAGVYRIFQQTFNSNGTQRGGETIVDFAAPGTENAASRASIAALKDGSWVVIYAVGETEGAPTAAYVQRFGVNYVPDPVIDDKPDPVVALNWAGTAGNDVKVGTILDDVLRGLAGKDTLSGGDGDDRIYGGYGNDLLTGDAGKDIFVFDAKLGTSKTDRKVNFDTITDFKVGQDKIWLENKIFTKLGKKGSETKPLALAKKYFAVGDKAKDDDDYILYNKKTGILSYDPDGNGSKPAIEIAKLSKNLKLTNKDFFIV
ncbi:calcium-binding protein [Microvirga flavescens]|uniref:calcium-binding protein n=1 Tax=Microvirga flavescens TaxID=2249811 RepID=UPI001300A797|nr:hypothetical protein [Microvirga flavescens]